MKEYVLRLRADNDAVDNDPPMALFEVGNDQPIATHANGYDTTAFVIEGQVIDPASCLTKEGLLDDVQGRAVGSELWRRLTPGDIGATVAPLVYDSRVYLDLRSETLAAYPWELLNDSVSALFAESRLCLIKPIRPAAGPPPGARPPADHPLRVLVVVGTDPSDEKIRANDELVAIEAAAHARNDEVLLRALQRPKPQDIDTALRDFQPHVFHFIGHGFQESAKAEPQIDVFYEIGEDHLNDPWKADRIRRVFRNSPPGLVVLNACLTGGSPTASASLVQAFLDAGSSAVVAMMGEIRDDASRAFSEYFYGELFAGHAVDAAVMTARQKVRDEAVGEGSQDNVAALRSNWPLPRLTVRGDVENAVTMTRSGAQGLPHWLAEDFVTRWDERWRVWKAMDGTYSRLALVTGSERVGKTELLNTVAQTCARHGETVIMVDVSGPTTGDTWRSLLHRIADAVHSSGHPAERLNEIADAPGLSRDVIARFTDELPQYAGPGGLMIVLDGLSEWLADLVEKTLLPELCGPYLLKTAKPPVRMMITMREDYQDAWERLPDTWRSLRATWEPIQVGQFLDDEWNRALTHFIAHWAKKVAKPKREQFQDAAEITGRGVSKDGSGFEALRGIAHAMRR